MHKWQNSIMNKNINKRVAELRLHLRKNGLAAYIFPSTDPHHSEYPPEYWKTREWISGFNGSAGTAVVTTEGHSVPLDERTFGGHTVRHAMAGGGSSAGKRRGHGRMDQLRRRNPHRQGRAHPLRTAP